MAQVKIYGSSDDLIEVEGDLPGCDEYNAEQGRFVLTGPEGGIRIGVEYGTGGLWWISIAPIEEDRPMLPVGISSADNGYGSLATIDGVDLVVREA